MSGHCRTKGSRVAGLARHCGLVLLLAGGALHASAAEVTVRDVASGQPLENAVVEIFVDREASEADISAAQVIQRDKTFVPHVTVVPVGGAVAFPNRDTTRHHVFSFSPAKTFEIKLYLEDTPPAIVFERAGVVVLGCNIHDHMLAFIVVSEATAHAVTGADGRARFDALPPGEHRLRVWHPRLEDTHQQWWEGRVEAGATRDVALELRASAPLERRTSPLQQRLREAGEAGRVR